MRSAADLPDDRVGKLAEQGLVLDPFAGSGTSCVAALKNGRAYVGYEIEEEYVGLAEARLAAARESSEH